MQNEELESEEFQFTLPLTELGGFRPFIDRYFTQKFITEEHVKDCQDTYMFIHSNRLIMVGLSKKNQYITGMNKVKKVDFSHHFAGDFSSMVKGKKKSDTF